MNRPSRFFILILSTVYLLLSTAPALAADAVFFAFAPDGWASQRFEFSSAAGPVYEIFAPGVNALMTGFDLWVDNTGEDGPLTLRLSDEVHQLAVRNVTLPHLAEIPGGYKFHVNLTTPIAISATGTYTLQIESDLPNFGLYSADRILTLDHNQTFVSQYSHGAAKIGPALQPFTFKLALYAPAESGADYIFTDPDQITASSTPVASTPQQSYVTITNARVVNTTATSATFSWTTNIAADSRVSIRTQLNPNFIFTSATDPTLELEHTITVNGLIPGVNYFADIFSNQGESIILTTYTIGFSTPIASQQTPVNTQPPANSQQPTNNAVQPPANNTQPTTPTNTNTPAQTNQSTNPPANSNTAAPSSGGQSASTNSNTGAPGSGNAPVTIGQSQELTIGPGMRSNNTNFIWQSPSNGEPMNGYRIDIFDYDHNLERSIRVPAGEHSKEIPGLTSGVHHVIVYGVGADETYTKVAPSQSITVIKKQIALRFGVGGGILAVIALFGWLAIWKFKKEKTILPAEEGYDPQGF